MHVGIFDRILKKEEEINLLNESDQNGIFCSLNELSNAKITKYRMILKSIL